MQGTVHPFDLEGLGAVGNLQGSLNTHPSLNQRKRFDENVVVGEKPFFVFQQG